MSYQLQHAAIASELRKAGMNADAASRIAAILSNSAQQVRTGPQTHDLTPSALRRVTPELRKYVLQNLDFNEGDPDHRRQKTQPGEAKARPRQASSVRTDAIPQQSSESLGVGEGGYTEVRTDGDKVSVGLRVRSTGQILTLEEASNTLVGKNLRVDTQPEASGGLRAFIEEQGQEMVLKFALDIAFVVSSVISSLQAQGLIGGSGGQTGGSAGAGGSADGGDDPCSSTQSRVEVVTAVECVNGNLVVTTSSIASSSC